MNLKDQLIDSSRIVADLATGYVLEKPDRINEAVELAFAGVDKVSARAMRVIYFCAIRNNDIVKPFLRLFADKLHKSNNQSIIGGILRIFSLNILPDDDEELGKIVDFCFEHMKREKVSAGIRVFTMETLYMVSLREPDLKQELLYSIEELIDDSTAAFKVRGAAILQKLRKEMKQK